MGALVLWIAAAACAPTSSVVHSITPLKSSDFFVAGYHPYWAGDSWTSYPLDALDELFFFELEAGADGGILDAHGWPDEWQAMAAAATEQGVQVVPTISMHDPDAFQELFADAQRVQRLVGEIVNLLDASEALSGIHLDFEVFQPVDLTVRDGFTGFVMSLAARVRESHPGRSLSTFVMAFDDDDVYNERALGQIVDYLVVQGYDYHHMGSETAGPVGPTRGWGRLNWSNVLDRFVGFGVPARKLVMAVPLYGYEWPVDSNEMAAATRGPGGTVPYAAASDVLRDAPRARDRAAEHGTERDPESGVPYYSFERADGWVQDWFDDAVSLRAKYEFVRANGLGGIALFPLAYGDEALWADLRRAFSSPR